MLDCKEFPDRIETSLSGKLLMTVAQLNKTTAFSNEERHQFGLLGKIPYRVENLSEQMARAYAQYAQYEEDIQKHIYLNNLHDKNQVLFYRLISEHLAEMLPVIYTPTVGTAVQAFSREFRQPRGLFISYPDQEYIDEILDNRSNPDIDLIVVTDGEGVLGIGDQGIGGINIPIAKLMVYTLCAGISPLRTLPIMLDVGTNNPQLLNDPFYLGWRHERLKGKEYDDFIAKFVASVQRKFPKAFLHWEDLGRDNARRILDEYENKCCTFNDDIQGTGCVTLAAILSAIKITKTNLNEQRIIIFGAGTAGTGVADQIHAAMLHQGMSEADARKCFWLIDRHGLITNTTPDLTHGQKPYARHISEIAHWENTDLLEVVKQIKPTILIGASAQARKFSEAVIKTMASHVTHPIILPLSNPTSRIEATPEQLIQWTEGRALIAAGTPFKPVTYANKTHVISQCNNALVFPGIGLGVLAVRAKKLSKEMLWVATQTLSEFSSEAILPGLDQARETAFLIAINVAKQAIKEGLARTSLPENITLEDHIRSLMWHPEYVPLVLK